MSYARSVELAAALTAVGIRTTADPRSATPPCVLITPASRTFDLSCGYTARWDLWALVPGTANADAAKQLSDLVDALSAQLPLEVAESASYALSPDSPAFPAFRCQFTEAVQ